MAIKLTFYGVAYEPAFDIPGLAIMGRQIRQLALYNFPLRQRVYLQTGIEQINRNDYFAIAINR